MAKTYKKKQDNFLRNIFIAFGALFVILMGTFVIMSIMEPDYEDFDAVPSYSEAANMPEGTYGVYFYSDTCSACATIKSPILNFADSNALGLKIYTMNLERTEGSFTEISGLSATPTLLIYKDGQLVDFLQSGETVITFIEEVEAGEYTKLD